MKQTLEEWNNYKPIKYGEKETKQHKQIGSNKINTSIEGIFSQSIAFLKQNFIATSIPQRPETGSLPTHQPARSATVPLNRQHRDRAVKPAASSGFNIHCHASGK